MKLALPTVICCCVFTTVLPLVKGATGELNASLKKRLKALLQNRMKRELPGDIIMLSEEQCNDILSQLQQEGTENTVSPSPSPGLLIRRRKSTTSKSGGCVLVTCAIHDLVFRLHQNTNNGKEATAPPRHFSAKGYGRRRRRSLLKTFLPAIQTRRQRPKTEAAQQVRQLKSTRTAA
ncbi:pro-adrenomedullin [Cheilinus undulatus]|uniref:pro-adrenomedullin n=1 Tax=Cheilinus undulatus TaxID=241271 RepID=UPI001BD1F32A|nr:pro-adrenomedullin [Cheilinus undulatus]